MTADPQNPKVGDRFVNDYSLTKSDVADVRFVDDDGSVLYRYVDGPCVGERYVCTAAQFASHFTPAPEPLITKPVVLYGIGPFWHHAYDPVSLRYCNTCPSITILPDHTWVEGTPS